MRVWALLLALSAAAPALALAQVVAPSAEPGAEPGAGRAPGGAVFRPVPSGPDGRPLEYRPPQPPKPDLLEAGAAELRLLDKMTGLIDTFTMPVGETRTAERLEITLHACRATRPGAAPEAVAHLTIRDLREAAARFEGWMFASSPALSALDHARYDVWVLSCSTVAGEASSARE